MTPHEAPPAAADGRSSDDDRLETLLVHLVGRIEQQMTTLERTEHVKRMIRMIETSLEILVTILDTGIANFDVNFFADDLPAVWRLRERSKVVLDVLDRESWTNMFSLSPKASHETLVMHRNLGKTFAQSYRDLLARFGEKFQAAKLREDFRESCVAFVDDFAQRW
ncbi:MAG: hypothetical protein ACKV2Q_18215 [Planctomycetaceae bacterium]